MVIFVLTLLLSAVFAQQTLRQAAQGKIYIGSAANYGTLNGGDQNYKTVLSQQFSLVTAENGCKWGATEPNRGQYSFTQCDGVLNFAHANGMAFRGHNLCWGSGNPNWLQNGGLNAAQKKQVLIDHITTVVKRYNDTPLCWDVVNEAVADSGNDVLKPTVWYPDVPDFIDVAFQTARAANPSVKLFYNDYNIGSATGWSQAKSDKVYNLIKSMKQRNIPIDGVGFQLHVDLNYDNMVAGVIQNIQRYAALGIEVHFTEIDVSCPGCSAQQLQTQAKIYGDLVNACLNNKDTCKSFESWGYTDKYTWLGSDKHPLPFDENYNKKPAFNSLLAALQAHKE
jgi:endo-1,4-beta-xylanase